ncbi:hypothetical protein [Aminobacter sp. LjRoot7]|uniref:hypothetical protein n=1 Tax=Aminobacter sp. LjRoot7 TaxID=3342335 RepID=UPI003ECEA55B
MRKHLKLGKADEALHAAADLDVPSRSRYSSAPGAAEGVQRYMIQCKHWSGMSMLISTQPCLPTTNETKRAI